VQPRHDLVIRHATVVSDGVAATADIAVANGRIANVGTLTGEAAATEVDASDLVAIPGVVEMHAHLREPGLTHKEDVATGTRAAACGGVTTVCDMPNTLPPVATERAFREKAEAIGGSCWVDVGLWAGGTKPDELRGMRRAGAIGVKVYMVSGPGFEPLYTGDIPTLESVLAVAKETHWLVAAHVGDDNLAAAERQGLIAAGRNDARAFLALQHGDASLTGLRRYLDTARRVDVPVHVAHLSIFGVEALETVRRARAAGATVTTEACIPALGSRDLDRLGIYALASAMEDRDVEIWWRAIADGEIDAIATDHAPHTRAEKAPGERDIWAAPPGHPALQTTLPLAYDAVLTGRWSIESLVDAMASRPARLLGLHSKGRIAVGADADIALLDPNGSWTVDQAELESKVGWSPFDGRTLRGRVHSTYLRGRLVARAGEIVAEHPTGYVLARRD